MTNPNQENNNNKAVPKEVLDEKLKKVINESNKEAEILLTTQHADLLFNPIFGKRLFWGDNANNSAFFDAIYNVSNELYQELHNEVVNSTYSNLVVQSFIKNFFSTFPEVDTFDHRQGIQKIVQSIGYYPKDFAHFSGHQVVPVDQVKTKSGICWSYAIRAIYKYYGHEAGGELDQKIVSSPQYKRSEGAFTRSSYFRDRFRFNYIGQGTETDFTIDRSNYKYKNIILPTLDSTKNLLKNYGPLVFNEHHKNAGHALTLAGVNQYGLHLRSDNYRYTLTDYPQYLEMRHPWYTITQDGIDEREQLTKTLFELDYDKVDLKKLQDHSFQNNLEQYLRDVIRKHGRGLTENADTENVKKSVMLYDPLYFIGEKKQQQTFQESFTSDKIYELVFTHVLTKDQKARDLIEQVNKCFYEIINTFNNENKSNEYEIPKKSLKKLQHELNNYKNYLQFTVYAENRDLNELRATIQRYINDTIPLSDTPENAWGVMKSSFVSRTRRYIDAALSNGKFKEAELWAKGLEQYLRKFKSAHIRKLQLDQYIKQSVNSIRNMFAQATKDFKKFVSSDEFKTTKSQYFQSSMAVGFNTGTDFFIGVLPEWIQPGATAFNAWFAACQEAMWQETKKFYHVIGKSISHMSQSMRLVMEETMRLGRSAFTYSCREVRRGKFGFIITSSATLASLGWSTIWAGLKIYIADLIAAAAATSAIITETVTTIGAVVITVEAAVIAIIVGCLAVLGHGLYHSITMPRLPKTERLKFVLAEAESMFQCDMGNSFLISTNPNYSMPPLFFDMLLEANEEKAPEEQSDNELKKESVFEEEASQPQTTNNDNKTKDKDKNQSQNNSKKIKKLQAQMTAIRLHYYQSRSAYHVCKLLHFLEYCETGALQPSKELLSKPILKFRKPLEQNAVSPFKNKDVFDIENVKSKIESHLNTIVKNIQGNNISDKRYKKHIKTYKNFKKEVDDVFKNFSNFLNKADIYILFDAHKLLDKFSHQVAFSITDIKDDTTASKIRNKIIELRDKHYKKFNTKYKKITSPDTNPR